MKKSFSYKTACIISLIVSLVLMAAVRLIKTGNSACDVLISTLITRTALAVAFVFLIKHLGFKVFSVTPKNALLLIPCFAVVINNLPIIALSGGSASISSSVQKIILLAASCLAVAAYEELAFRGALFLMICKNKKSKKDIFLSTVISSAVFALFHMFNLIDGAGLVPVMMQIGYSFLIGGMCATVLIVCKSIYPCIILHAIFNFCGNIVPTFGTGYETVWDPATIAITVILAMICAAAVIYSLLRYGDKNINSFYSE